jgi:GLPGLI family protein
MKSIFKIILLIALIGISSGLGAQTNMQGTVTYLQNSNWTKMMTSLDYLTQNQKDRMLYIGGNRPGWKEYKILNFNESVSKFENSDIQADNEFRGWSPKKEVYFIKNDKDKNTLQSVQTLNGRDYIINDIISNPQWKILNNMKEIAGHICMNATSYDSIRKQSIEAWFALDIPVAWGPFFYSGLPGLILEVDINNGAVILTAEKIENLTVNKPFDLPKKLKGKKVNLNQYNKMISDHIAEKRKTEQPWFWGVPYL